MMPRIGPLLLTALLSALATTTAAAQFGDPWADSPQHRGFVGTLGVGSGNVTTEVAGEFASAGAPGSARSSASAVTYDLFLGVALSARWRLGAEVALMPGGLSEKYSSSVGSEGTTVFYSLGAAYYPIATVGLWVKANAGYGVVNYHAPLLASGLPTGQTVTLSGGAFSAGAGVGYDWRPGDSGFLIIGFANFMAQLSTVTLSAPPQPWSCRTNMLQIGIAFGYNR